MERINDARAADLSARCQTLNMLGTGDEREQAIIDLLADRADHKAEIEALEVKLVAFKVERARLLKNAIEAWETAHNNKADADRAEAQLAASA